MRINANIFIVLALSLTLSGCVGGFLNNDSGGGKGEPEYQKGVIVKGFPGLPLYPEAQVVESYGYNDKYGASFISDDDLNKVFEFYNQSLGKLGWESAPARRSETNFEFRVKSKDSQGTVIVNTAADGKKTAITIAVEPRE